MPDYDADWVAAQAIGKDPSLSREVATVLAVDAWRHLRDLGELDAPAVARSLLAEQDVDASHASVVAKAAVDYCTEHGVPV